MAIRYNVKIDRFYDDSTGKFVTNITGLLSSIGRRERKRTERNGERDKWKRDLKRRIKNRRKKIKVRKKPKPPTTPAQHFDFEFKSKAGNIDLYLDEIIFRNLEFMEEEVIY